MLYEVITYAIASFLYRMFIMAIILVTVASQYFVLGVVMALCRITSYNVCYTKLLRLILVGGAGNAGTLNEIRGGVLTGPLVIDGNEGVNALVVTDADERAFVDVHLAHAFHARPDALGIRKQIGFHPEIVDAF